MAASDPVLTTWRYEATRSEPHVVIPDGCQDVILRFSPQAPPELMISALQSGPRQVQIKAGEVLHGARLAPGARVQAGTLEGVWSTASGCPNTLWRHVQEAVSVEPEIEMILKALAEQATSPSAASATARLGMRTLQRRMSRAQLPSPQFWVQLARVRQAARSIRAQVPLAEAAYVHGYADQAHMTRAFRRWLGWTPGQLARARDSVFDQLDASGYG